MSYISITQCQSKVETIIRIVFWYFCQWHHNEIENVFNTEITINITNFGGFYNIPGFWGKLPVACSVALLTLTMSESESCAQK